MVPAALCSLVNGPANVGIGWGTDDFALRVLVKGKNPFVPGQFQKAQSAAGDGLEVGHHVLVTHFQPGRGHFVPDGQPET